MKGKPLIELNDSELTARGYNLGLKVVPNMLHVLTIEQLEYYEVNLPELKNALARGFVIPGIEPVGEKEPLVPPKDLSPVVFKTADTDLAMWITKVEEFSEKYLGVKVSLREMFAIPEDLPWLSAIPVFDPGGDFTNQKAVELLKKLGLTVWEEVDVMLYSGSEASVGSTLHFIQNSVRPDEDTLGMSPNQLVATGKNWLSLRGYALAFGLHHFITQKYLDPKTFTWFPNARLSSGEVAHGDWDPGLRRFGFHWDNPDYSGPDSGARLAIPIPLLS